MGGRIFLVLWYTYPFRPTPKAWDSNDSEHHAKKFCKNQKRETPWNSEARFKILQKTKSAVLYRHTVICSVVVCRTVPLWCVMQCAFPYCNQAIREESPFFVGAERLKSLKFQHVPCVTTVCHPFGYAVTVAITGFQRFVTNVTKFLNITYTYIYFYVIVQKCNPRDMYIYIMVTMVTYIYL